MSVVVFAASMLAGTSCHSPDDPGHTNRVSALVNDTTVTFTRILSVTVERYSTTSVGHFELRATNGSDTLEIVGLAEKDVAHPLYSSVDLVRLRRRWGVFQDSGTVRTIMDTILCSAYGTNVLAGVVKVPGAVPSVSGMRDSLRLEANFDVTYY